MDDIRSAPAAIDRRQVIPPRGLEGTASVRSGGECSRLSIVWQFCGRCPEGAGRCDAAAQAQTENDEKGGLRRSYPKFGFDIHSFFPTFSRKGIQS